MAEQEPFQLRNQFLQDIADQVDKLKRENPTFIAYAKKQVSRFIELYQKYQTKKEAAEKQEHEDIHAVLTKRKYRINKKKYFNANEKVRLDYQKSLRPPKEGLIIDDDISYDIKGKKGQIKESEFVGWIRQPLEVPNNPMYWPTFIRQSKYSKEPNKVYFMTALAVIHDFVLGGRSEPLLPDNSIFGLMWYNIENGYQEYTADTINNCLVVIEAAFTEEKRSEYIEIESSRFNNGQSKCLLMDLSLYTGNKARSEVKYDENRHGKRQPDTLKERLRDNGYEHLREFFHKEGKYITCEKKIVLIDKNNTV